MKIGDPSAAQQMSLEHIASQGPKMPKAGQVPGAKGDSPEAIHEVAKNFESLFINEIMKNMRKTLPKDGLLSKGFANNVFNSMLDQEYSQIASRSGQFGLADAIARQLGADPAEITQRERLRAGHAGEADAAESASGADGDALPAWALSEIQSDPWTPNASAVDPHDTRQVTPGLSAPKRSEFAPTPAADERSASAPISSQRARQAYQELTQPMVTPTQTRVKR